MCRPEAEWLKELKNQVLPTVKICDLSDTDELDKIKMSGLDNSRRQRRRLNELWIRQKFTSWFPAVQPPSPTPPTVEFGPWQKDHVEDFLDNIDEVAETFLPLLAYYDGLKEPIDELKDRISDVEQEEAKSVYKQFFGQSDTENCWNESLRMAETIFNRISPDRRSLREQVAIYDNLSQAMTSESAVQLASQVANESSPILSVLSVIKLARLLATQSGDIEPDIVGKHSSSARAVMQYAREKNISIEQATTELEIVGLKLLRTTPCSIPVPSVGYHLVIEAKRIHDFMSKLKETNLCDQIIQKRIDQLNQNPELCSNWRKTGYEAGGATKSIIEIFNRFRSNVEGLRSEIENSSLINPSTARAYLDFEAVTYKDPWMSLCHYDLDVVLKDLPQNPSELAAELGITEVEATNSALSALLQERLQLFSSPDMKSLLPRSNSDRLSPASQVILKKKLLYLLTYAPNVNWRDQESVNLLQLRVVEGTQGRCPDGVASFCDDFLTNMLVDNPGTMNFESLSPEISKLIVVVSVFIFQWKIHFQRMHLPRHKAQYEARTALGLVLKNVLMLPLSLPGEYTSLIYPQFAAQGQVNPSAVDSDEICTRFLRGGIITCCDPNNHVTHTVEFLPLSLGHLVNEFRNCISHADTGRFNPPQTNAPTHSGDLEPAPVFNYSINENIITQFLEVDIAIGPFYRSAKSSGWTCENIYFKSLSEDEESFSASMPFIAQVLKDRAYLRIFQVCKYATTSPNFDLHAPSSWTFDS